MSGVRGNGQELGGCFALGPWRVRRAGYGEALAPVFDALNAHVATMHFNGQSTVELDGDRATGESYCLAHHLTEAGDGSRTLMVASIRYLDTFAKQDGAWLFAQRRLMVNWTDTRPSVS